MNSAKGQSRIPVPTAAMVRAWPVTVDVPTAGRCWQLGRDASYDLARSGKFPVPVLRLGRRLVVTRAAIMSKLGISETDGMQPLTVHAPNTGTSAQVDGAASSLRSDARDSTEAA